jgi:hypothetical protein
MKKFSKSGPPARAERSERPGRKAYAGAGDAPKRAYAPRSAEGPKRAYAPRTGDAPKRAYAPRTGDAPKRAYAPRTGDAPKRPYAPRPAAGSDAPPRRSYRRDDDGGAPPARSAYGNPYERVQRPRGSDEGAEAPRGAPGRGFTVTLDPDVARVFRGDASVNKALRLVLQLMQVIEGPGPRGDRPAPRPRTGYQGSDEARGFSRKPRFVDNDDEDVE